MHVVTCVCYVQKTTYLAKMDDIVQLPVHDMKGEGKTAIYQLALQKRDQKKEKTRLRIWDAVNVSMAPGEINVVIYNDGYAFKAEPQ